LSSYDDDDDDVDDEFDDDVDSPYRSWSRYVVVFAATAPTIDKIAIAIAIASLCFNVVIPPCVPH
jgi:hypothetical protein